MIPSVTLEPLSEKMRREIYELRAKDRAKQENADAFRKHLIARTLRQPDIALKVILGVAAINHRGIHERD